MIQAEDCEVHPELWLVETAIRMLAIQDGEVVVARHTRESWDVAAVTLNAAIEAFRACSSAVAALRELHACVGDYPGGVVVGMIEINGDVSTGIMIRGASECDA